MPNITSAQLNLIQGGEFIQIQVRYNAVFSQFERRLAGLGLGFLEQIAVIGVDPPGGTTGLNLVSVTRQIIVADGAGQISIPRLFSTSFLPRSFFDEDPSPLGPNFDEDEFRARIRILTVGFPAAATPDTFTNQQVLGGVVVTPS